MSQVPQLLDPSEIAIPDISELEIEDNKPVDNFQSDIERQKATRLAERLRQMGIDPDTI